MIEVINAVGIVGGMGSYATVDFFRRIVDAFPAQKEWERPRVLIDNYCTMPSRVRAILYNERRDELVDDLRDSVRNLIRSGAERIIFACNTSHVFIPEVMAGVPESREKIIDIIRECADEISVEYMSLGGGLTLIATEGTIETGIYADTFWDYGISIDSPGRQQYDELRYFIEAVKQNAIDDRAMRSFRDFVEGFVSGAVILGCTEIPILYRRCRECGFVFTKRVYDPLQSAINFLVRLYRA